MIRGEKRAKMKARRAEKRREARQVAKMRRAVEKHGGMMMHFVRK